MPTELQNLRQLLEEGAARAQRLGRSFQTMEQPMRDMAAAFYRAAAGIREHERAPYWSKYTLGEKELRRDRKMR